MLIQACYYLKIAENRLFKQILQICVLQITHNNASDPKSLIIIYIIILNHFSSVFLLMKTCFYVKIAENLIFRQCSNSLLPRHALQIGILPIRDSMRWPSKVT